MVGGDLRVPAEGQEGAPQAFRFLTVYRLHLREVVCDCRHCYH
jgi:hypothetical protein